MRRTEIFFEGKWRDVTNRKAVVFGVGNMFVDWWQGIQLPDIDYVVDSDKNKQGRIVQIGVKEYEITSPLLLNCLSPDSYYVVFPGRRFVKERQDFVENEIAGQERKSYICGVSIRYSYDDLYEMMLCDPIIRRKIKEQNCTLQINEYIKKFSVIIKKKLRDTRIDRYIPIEKGHKIVFIFGNEYSKYICSIRGWFCLNPANVTSWRVSPNNAKILKEIARIKKKIGISQKLTIYEDDEGFLIQHYGNDNVDVKKDEVKKKIVNKLNRLHNCGEKIAVVADITDRYRYELESLRHKNGPILLAEIDKHMQSVLNYIKSLDVMNVICHGDFHQGNVIEWEHEIYFIDWDFMCMTNPLYDVCRFLYYASIGEYNPNDNRHDSLYADDMESLYGKLDEFLSAYYGRAVKAEELQQATAMMLVNECIEMCLRLNRNQENTDANLQTVLCNIIRWEKLL